MTLPGRQRRDRDENRRVIIWSGWCLFIRLSHKWEVSVIDHIYIRVSFWKIGSKNKIAELSYEEVESPTEGKIVLVPDFEEFEVKLIVADTSTKYSTTIPILEKVEGREYYGRSATQIEGKVSIQKNSEQGLAAFIYGKDGLSTTPIQNIEQGEIDQQNDYIYFISFQFSE